MTASIGAAISSGPSVTAVDGGSSIFRIALSGKREAMNRLQAELPAKENAVRTIDAELAPKKATERQITSFLPTGIPSAFPIEEFRRIVDAIKAKLPPASIRRMDIARIILLADAPLPGTDAEAITRLQEINAAYQAAQSAIESAEATVDAANAKAQHVMRPRLYDVIPFAKRARSAFQAYAPKSASNQLKKAKAAKETKEAEAELIKAIQHVGARAAHDRILPEIAAIEARKAEAARELQSLKDSIEAAARNLSEDAIKAHLEERLDNKHPDEVNRVYAIYAHDAFTRLRTLWGIMPDPAKLVAADGYKTLFGDKLRVDGQDITFHNGKPGAESRSLTVTSKEIRLESSMSDDELMAGLAYANAIWGKKGLKINTKDAHLRRRLLVLAEELKIEKYQAKAPLSFTVWGKGGAKTRDITTSLLHRRTVGRMLTARNNGQETHSVSRPFSRTRAAARNTLRYSANMMKKIGGKVAAARRPSGSAIASPIPAAAPTAS